MRMEKRPMAWLLACGLLAAAARVAGAAAPTTRDADVDDLRAQVAQLKSQVSQLQGRQQDDEDKTAAMIQHVLADADAHSKLFDLNGENAGYANRRFFIRSSDGNFLFQPWIHLQIRDSTNFRNDGKGHGAAQDTENGFELRRARFGFDGNLFSPDLTYFINWATNRENGTLNVVSSAGTSVGTGTSPVGGLPVLEEAWVKFHFANSPYYIKVGQMHDPLDHENIVGSKFRAPEASLQGDIFGNTDTFTQAATFIYDDKGPIRFEGGVNDGIRSANTNFEDFPNGGIAYDWGVAGRVEYKVMGDWSDYNQITNYGDKHDLLVIGSGVDYSEGGRSNTLSHTLDVQYGVPNGLFLYGAYFGRYTNHNRGIPSGGSVSTSLATPAVSGRDTYEPSILGQVGYMINGNVEPFARYEYMHLQGTPAGSYNDVTEISVGANWYLQGHNVKLTGQAMYLPHGIPISDDSNDVLLSNDKGEIVFIAQLQLLI